jgi:hypothetical protein
LQHPQTGVHGSFSYDGFPLFWRVHWMPPGFSDLNPSFAGSCSSFFSTNGRTGNNSSIDARFRASRFPSRDAGLEE